MSASIDRDALREEVRRSHGRRLARGELLFAQGEPGSSLFVIESGEIELRRQAPGGPRTLARLGPGDLLGELGPREGGARRASAVAVRESLLLEFDVATCERMCAEAPPIAIELLRQVSARTAELERRLADLDADDLLGAVTRAILRRCEAEAGAAQVAAGLRELAEEAGVPLLQAYHAVHGLIDRRLVRLDGGTLSVPALEALHACIPSTTPPEAPFTDDR